VCLLSGQAILVTNRFKYQNTMLSYDDIETWYWCVSKIEAVGFYNSDSVAGSSQPHKHMQLVPLDVLRQMYATAAAANPPLADSEPYSGKVLFLHSQQETDLTLTVQLSVSLLVMQASLPIEKLIFPHIETGDWALYDPLGGEEHVHSLPQVTPKQSQTSPPSC
jgi:ATP adenylyltransferase/5',5'''-P-1,P-4-tetraphosphate phosphorylase II